MLFFIKVLNPDINAEVWRNKLFLYKPTCGKIMFDRDVIAEVSEIITNTVLHIMIL